MYNPNLTRSQKIILAGILAVFAIIHLFIVCFNHYHFRTFTLDYGNYNFIWFDCAHLRVSTIPVTKIWGVERHFLHDHFTMTFFLLAPAYWLLAPVTGTYTLLILQVAFVMAGAWATYKLALVKSGKYWFGICGLLYYFFMYGRYSSYQNDCNLAIMGAAMLPVFIYFFETRQRWPSILVFAFLILNREDMPICLFFLCLAFAFIHRKDPLLRKRALWFSVLSLASFIIILFVLIPALHDEVNDFRLFDYPVLGESPWKAVVFVAQHPFLAIKYLFVNHTSEPGLDGVKERFYLMYGLSGGFLLVFRPAYLFLLIPFLAKKMYNDNPMRWGYETYYSVEEASMIPALVILWLCDLKWIRIRNAMLVIVCLATLLTTMYCTHIAYYPNPYLKFNLADKNYYKPHFNAAHLHQVLRLIPDDAPVAASSAILPHLALREKIYQFPDLEDAEFAVFHLHHDTYPYSPEKFNEELHKMVLSGRWRLLASDPDFLLLQKKGSRSAE